MEKTLELKEPKTVKELLGAYSDSLPFSGDFDRFTPTCYKNLPEKIRPVFHIKRLNVGERTELRLLENKIYSYAEKMALESQVSGKDIDFDIESAEFKLINKEYLELQFSFIKDWVKFYDSEGKKLKLSLKNYDLIPDEGKAEILLRIKKISGLSREEQDFLD